MPTTLPFGLNAYSLIKMIDIEKLVEYLNTLYPDLKYRVEQFSFHDSTITKFEKRVRPTPTSYLLGRLNDNWNILLDDQRNSDGCTSMLANLNRLYEIEGLKVAFNEGPASFYSEGTHFTYYTHQTKRVVQASWDDNKWVFFQSGPILPFEKPEYYKKRKIADRLNKKILEDYLQAMKLSDIPSLLMASDKILKLVKYWPDRIAHV